ncbi:MAG: hypothetical protein KF773_00320 [Deltaproteobacteria bacterium]|nr:hypothetical protein [Deltaproteobacteria bacterium]MCW5806174.1 hypothetical protein [Deltaproteobacteria bacterium]
MNHDLDGLTPQEQALLGCWEGFHGASRVSYRFNTDRGIDSTLEDGTFRQGTYTAGQNMMELDFGKPARHRIFLTTGTISYVDEPGQLTRQTCGG